MATQAGGEEALRLREPLPVTGQAQPASALSGVGHKLFCVSGPTTTFPGPPQRSPLSGGAETRLRGGRLCQGSAQARAVVWRVEGSGLAS